MKKIYTFALSLCFASLSQASLSENYLEQQNYLYFEESFKTEFPTSQDKKNFLLTKINSGHPIVYWLLANEYSKDVLKSQFVVTDKKLLMFTKQMFYTALVLTQQDSHFCIEKRPQNASSELLSKFPQIMDFERKYFDNNLEVMEKSIDFVNNLPNRKPPNWACLQFGDKMNTSTYGRTYSSTDFRLIKENINKKLINSIKK